MRLYNETSIKNFNFSLQAEDNAVKFTEAQLDELDKALSELYPNGLREDELNNLFVLDEHLDFLSEQLGYDNFAKLQEANKEAELSTLSFNKDCYQTPFAITTFEVVQNAHKQAKQGDHIQQELLGRMYLEGSLSLRPNIQKGLYWMEKASQGDDAICQTASTCLEKIKELGKHPSVDAIQEALAEVEALENEKMQSQSQGKSR